MTFKMPQKINLGSYFSTTLYAAIYHSKNIQENPFYYRSIMGYFLPSWQRDLIWSTDKKIKLIESLWLGLGIGTFTYNVSPIHGSKFDNLLIDGQQRMNAIECYLNDKFHVFGVVYSDLPEPDKRSFSSRHFHSYVTKSDDEDFLKNYYTRLNFGGVSHSETDHPDFRE